MAGPDRLPLDYLESRRARFSGAYQMAPGEYFPIPTPDVEDHKLERYVPVSVDDAFRHKSSAQSRARLLLALAAQNDFEDDEKERLDRIEAAVNKYGFDSQPTVLFYLLGYTIDDRYLVGTSRETALTDLIEETLRVRNVYNKIRASAVLAPRKEYYTDAVMKFRDQAEALNDFTMNVVKPIADLEAIALREAAFIIIGGEVIRGGAWLAEWVAGLRFVAEFASVLRWTQTFVSLAAPRAFLVLSLLKSFVTGLGRLLLFGLAVKGNFDLGREVLDQLAIIYRYFAGVTASSRQMDEAGGIALEGWEVSDDPYEQEMVDYLQSTLPRDVVPSP